MKTILIVIIIILSFIVLWRFISVLKTLAPQPIPPVFPADSPDNPYIPNGPNFPSVSPGPIGPGITTQPGGGDGPSTNPFPTTTTTQPPNTWSQSIIGNIDTRILSGSPQNFFNIIDNINIEPIATTLSGISFNLDDRSLNVPDTTNNYNFSIGGTMTITSSNSSINTISQATGASINFHYGIYTDPNNIQILPSSGSGIVEDIEPSDSSIVGIDWSYNNIKFIGTKLYFYIYITDKVNFNLSNAIVDLTITIQKV